MCVISRLEAAKDDYRIHCEELEKQLVELQHRNDELTSLAEESRTLKDELDILRYVLVVRVSICSLCQYSVWLFWEVFDSFVFV